MSRVRQNYHEDSENGVNSLINFVHHASYSYSGLAFYFDRDDVALAGFYKYFKQMSDEKRALAEKLLTYQNKRGGTIVLQDIQKPQHDVWESSLAAMTATLEMEKAVGQRAIELCAAAEKLHDEHLADFIEDEILEPNVCSIKQVADHIANIKRVGPGLGEYSFDKETLQED